SPHHVKSALHEGHVIGVTVVTDTNGGHPLRSSPIREVQLARHRVAPRTNYVATGLKHAKVARIGVTAELAAVNERAGISVRHPCNHSSGEVGSDNDAQRIGQSRLDIGAVNRVYWGAVG